jgi:hypothetical protein
MGACALPDGVFQINLHSNQLTTDLAVLRGVQTRNSGDPGYYVLAGVLPASRFSGTVASVNAVLSTTLPPPADYYRFSATGMPTINRADIFKRTNGTAAVWHAANDGGTQVACAIPTQQNNLTQEITLANGDSFGVYVKPTIYNLSVPGCEIMIKYCDSNFDVGLTCPQVSVEAYSSELHTMTNFNRVTQCRIRTQLIVVKSAITSPGVNLGGVHPAIQGGLHGLVRVSDGVTMQSGLTANAMAFAIMGALPDTGGGITINYGASFGNVLVYLIKCSLVGMYIYPHGRALVVGVGGTGNTNSVAVIGPGADVEFIHPINTSVSSQPTIDFHSRGLIDLAQVHHGMVDTREGHRFVRVASLL